MTIEQGLPMEERRGDKRCPHGYTKRAACHDCRNHDAIAIENALVEVVDAYEGWIKLVGSKNRREALALAMAKAREVLEST